MPELPEVEAVARNVRKEAVGATIDRVRVLRARAIHPQTPRKIARAEGGKVLRIERRGKNILVPLDNGFTVRVHLGMTGNLTVIPDARLHADRVRVMMTFDDGRALALEDGRVFGRMQTFSAQELEKVLLGLGVEPLAREFTLEYLAGRAKKSKKPAKVFLMDQSIIAGLGNIYAAESLFLAKINPKRPMNKLKAPKIADLHAAIPAVLKKAIKFVTKGYRKPGYFEESRFEVYGRAGEPCYVCNTKIQRFEQAGRSTYWCPYCQR